MGRTQRIRSGYIDDYEAFSEPRFHRSDWCSSGKVAFATEGEARKRLRVWQRKSRRSAFDNERPYLCECGWYHVGGKYE